jgi:hypothetical protein
MTLLASNKHKLASSQHVISQQPAYCWPAKIWPHPFQRASG